MPFVNVNGVNLYYDLSGEHGDSMILVHGAMTSHVMWNFMIGDLSKSFKVIACDLRGHGESDKGEPSNYSIALFADDLRKLMDKFLIEKVHMGGFSMGGLVAEQFAVDYPQRLHSLILGGTPTRVPPYFPEWVVSLMMRLMRFEGLGKFLLRDVPKDRRRFIMKITMEAYEQAGRSVNKADLRASRAYLGNLPEGLSSIPVPILVVSGERDSLAEAEGLHNIIPKSRVAVVKGASHELTAERPEEFSRLISDFCLSLR